MHSKSAAIVGFIANLMPLYEPEKVDGVWCARSLADGTRIHPVDETDWDEERGTVRVCWQGEIGRSYETDGENMATLAIVRYVELHNLGQPSKQLANEVAFLSDHFRVKTGCSVYLPYDGAEPNLLDTVRKGAARLGESALIQLITKAAGL